MPKEKKPKPKKPLLTPRQNRFMKELAKGKTQAQAAIDAGYSPKHVDQGAHQALEQIRMKMPQIMEQHGLTDSVLIEDYLVPLMQAQETKFFAHQGIVKMKANIVNWQARRDGLDMAFKLKGSYSGPAEGGSGGHGPTVIVLDIPRPVRAVAVIDQAEKSSQ